jgi:UDP-N-acetylmuramoylalanine--D-glutamate ligase
MIPVTAFSGKRVALFGLGGSGLATARALVAGGAEVTAWDDSLSALDTARAAGIAVADLRGIDWRGLAAYVLSPGVPLTHPEPHWTVAYANAANLPIIGDVDLFFQERAQLAPSAPVVAITGTNGKSTTTALTAHLSAAAGRPTDVGGNIGTPVLELGPIAAERTTVIECSSYQIDLTPHAAPTVAIHLNLTPDHLDRHGTFEHYGAVKAKLLAGVPAGGTVVCGVDDAPSAAMADAAKRRGVRVKRISVTHPVTHGYVARGTTLIRMRDGAEEVVADLGGIGSLRGAHNAQNALAAVAAVSALGVSDDAIRAGLATFPGLDHRMQGIARLGRVLFVNDSKATNADATEKALSSYETIHWIAGGKAKAGGIEPLRAYFPRIAKAYLIGEAAGPFADTLHGVPHVISGTLDRAVAAAAADAHASHAAEPVVLLSPACASFDQFPNFEVRGRAFKDLVRALPGIVPIVS